jgi:hypothetical protein
MTAEDGFTWTAESGGGRIGLAWRLLGTVQWRDGVARFPVAPSRPGVYMVRLSTSGRYRNYIGEAADLRK